MKATWGEGGGNHSVLIVVHAVVVDHRPPIPIKPGGSIAGFSPDQALRSPRAKGREIFGESHEGCAASC